MDRKNALTDPKKLVRVELKNAGFDIDKVDTMSENVNAEQGVSAH